MPPSGLVFEVTAPTWISVSVTPGSVTCTTGPDGVVVALWPVGFFVPPEEHAAASTTSAAATATIRIRIPTPSARGAYLDEH